MRICDLPDCSEKHRAKGLCEFHYHRRRLTGDPYMVRQIHGDDVARFWSYVEKGDDHWIWVGGRDGSGYGKFRVGGAQVGAHRFAYELLVGPIPDGLMVAHLCEVRHCVNPDHIEAVTASERLRRFWVTAPAESAA